MFNHSDHCIPTQLCYEWNKRRDLLKDCKGSGPYDHRNPRCHRMWWARSDGGRYASAYDDAEQCSHAVRRNPRSGEVFLPRSYFPAGRWDSRPGTYRR
ncbi:hypothetical protein GCM10010260_16740 [Streptomyces filipinensis]|uniref:Uncharacterized protein n=1 Tax=Streptomyces filipinensis TaxID=66887 RepID=A0A918MAC6_9ACTN|nr:hypothetical protein GCM10010260_16740 [Streptomyces filipinensis]